MGLACAGHEPRAAEAAGVNPTRFAGVRHVDVTGSTNDDIAAMLGEPDAAGVTIVADYQQHGAGRKGRSWIAPPGTALLFTTALPEPVPTEHLWIVPFWSALAVHAALAGLGVDTLVRWPNDILLAERKLAGILCVSRVIGASAWVGCGIGVNVQRPPNGTAASEELAAVTPAPAFASEAAVMTRDELLDEILKRFDATLEWLRTPQNVARRWEDAAGIPGVPYRLLVDGETEPFEATALRLANGGALVVSQNGRERQVQLADARALRD